MSGLYGLCLEHSLGFDVVGCKDNMGITIKLHINTFSHSYIYTCVLPLMMHFVNVTSLKLTNVRVNLWIISYMFTI